MNINFMGLSIAGNGNKENLKKLYGNPEYRNAAMRAFNEIDKKSGNTDVFLKTESGKCEVREMNGTTFVGFNDKDYVDLSFVDSKDEVIMERRMFYTPENPDKDLTETDFDIIGEFFPDMRHSASEYNRKCDYYV